ncbi:hypothetical protein N4R57_06235 [Rhodobacteraceae bacterium D3-12]|nr:hypothetical protein N4R57_06235 [Rhodobacteraceae bacterium D3-12]
MVRFSMFRRALMVVCALALVASTTPDKAQAGPKASSAQLQRTINIVVSRAKRGEGRPISRGVTLRKVRQHGDIVMFDMTLTDPVLIAAGRKNPALLQREFITKMGANFCRKGKGTRRFIDAGGEIQIILADARRKMLAGGRLTKC